MMSGGLVTNVIYKPYKVYTYQGNFYIEGTSLDVLGIGRETGAVLTWESFRLFPVTREQIESAKLVDSKYEYVPEFVELEENRLKDIRSIDDINKMRELSEDKQNMIVETREQILHYSIEEYEYKRAELSSKADQLLQSDNFFEKEMGSVIKESVAKRDLERNVELFVR